MQAAQSLQDVRQARREAIAATMDRVREAVRTRGVTREVLVAIRQEQLELANQPDLFPEADFRPGKDQKGFDAIYRLSEDDDHGFALYLSTAQQGKKVPPHDHTTWAVIVGVKGRELNVFYERTDDGSVPGRGTVQEVRREMVQPGTGVMLMPDAIHHIEVASGDDTQHLHLYGLALEQLTERVTYDMGAGTYKAMNISPNIQEAR